MNIQIHASNTIPRPVDCGRSEYVLATGDRAVGRLQLLHNIYSPAGKRALLKAGLRPGMRVADFGCGTGATTRLLAEIVGEEGQVTGIDLHEPQLVQAGNLCTQSGHRNVSLCRADACDTGLPGETFDVVYCRFLLIHLPDPAACLWEMRRVLKRGGLIFVEDGDLSTAGSVPPSPLDETGRLFAQLGPRKGVDYLLGRNLYHMVKSAGFDDVEIEIHQPAIPRGENRAFLKWSVEEAGRGFIDAGLLTPGQLELLLQGMQSAMDNPDVLVLTPRMSLVWARKGSYAARRFPAPGN
jgi:SAM-dependent methyltransferase